MIDYILINPKTPENNNFLKYEWIDIEWKEIFRLININLDLLYGNGIDFWTTTQLDVILNLLKSFLDDYNEIVLKEDIKKMIVLFQTYVDEKCIIRIF